jgi:acetate CoA/acetoacetate CoA-transferase alpha subunit
MKTAITLEAAVAMIPDGASIMIGGFFGVGSPHRLIQGLVAAGRKDLTVIANDTAFTGIGIGRLIAGRMVKRLIASHIGANPETQQQMIAGELDVELVPQGTLAERIRAAGFGLGGVLTRTGLGTLVAAGKTTVEIDGETWLLEKPVRADFALICAKQADHFGNLTYEFTAQNFNPVMAMAARTVIAEAEEIVPVGAIPPDAVRTPGVLVDYLLERHA